MGVYTSGYNLSVVNASIINCGKDAIRFYSGKSLILRHSVLMDSKRGLSCADTTGDACIEGNVIRDNTDDGLYIRLRSKKSAVINDNQIIHNTGTYSCGIECNMGGGSVMMKNNTVNDNGNDGVYITGASNVNITNAVIEDNRNGYGVYTSGSNLSVVNASITNCGDDAIRFSSGKSLILRDSVLTASKKGLSCLDSTGDATIERNVIRDNIDDGLFIIRHGSGKNAIINDNRIIHNTGTYSCGIECSMGGGSVMMKNNTINDNADDGVFISGAEHSILVNNTISSNKGPGIRLHSCTANILFHNNL
ncbi:MAG: right-handed parallel beta-helix repeat-containing protein, partial [Euryarchaeota archaeon]|nr:right-handed parallel beta-helix repeat-containing protein [Euryarchaeota archaeon]